MLVKIVTKKRFKVIAMFMAVNLLAQIGFPTVAFALTSGPSQPEVGSFEPVNTNQMVDLFSGDFTYNIPLMNVPGPNGGYPINLAYHAGIGMEQEASWVGLGWNINAGAINRNLRGIPDDFKGDVIEKTVSMKPQRKLTFGIKDPVNIEVLGVDPKKGLIKSTSVYMYYDNYKGVGMGYGISLSTASSEQAGGPLQASLSLTSDSKEGLGVSPSLSLSREVRNQGFGFETGLNINSRHGLQSITFNVDLKIRNEPNEKKRCLSTEKYNKRYNRRKALNESGLGASTSFSSSTYVPMMDMPRVSYSGDFDFKIGQEPVSPADWSPLNFFVKYSENKISENQVAFGGYGVMYAQKNPSNRNIADFNREKDIPVNKNSKNLPIPSATNDVFSISGQGVGGAFKAHRSDIGVFLDPKIETTSGGGGFGSEFALGTTGVVGIKIGVNPKITVVKSYSGKWNNHSGGVINHYKFKDDITDSEFEPFYFKALGEIVTASSMSGGVQNNNDLPFQFELGKTWDGITRVPVVRNQIIHSGSSKSFLSENAELNTRQKRVQSIEYLTHKELGTADNVPCSPPCEDYTSAKPYHVSGKTDHHIGQISVLNPDGNRYVYGLPAYNTLQGDVSFSVNDDTNPTNSYDRIRDYNANDASILNDEGLSNLYSKTIMPPYAHSYLLTAVLSADYVDLTNDGPTEDDLGYWVKFNYLKKEKYKWRAPYEANKGNNIENKISNDMDDMSGYSYGEKEIMYLESIETKTHIAVYYLSEREDGVGVLGSNGGKDNDDKLLKLDKIVLKSKANLSQPIKTVHFDYNYTLCNNIPNNINFNGETGPGKLTLKNVWFTYFDNETKGELSPYKFIYSDVNPVYNINLIDRWGNYQAQGPFKNNAGTANLHPNFNHPYCNQFEDYSNRHADASAWNLTQITMPSGGILNIDYESDDYAYVQNRPAAQMFKIIGTGESTLNANAPLSKNDDRIYIELDRPVNATELAKYVSGINDIYFKAYMKLKRPEDALTLESARDYVEGYAKFTGNYGLHDPDPISGLSKKAWVKVKNVPPHQIFQTSINPIKLAGLREIRFNRSDLLSGQNTGLGAVSSMASIANVTPVLFTTVKDAMQMLMGFYNYGILAGWCDEIEVSSDTYPSYIRLNNPIGKKYGGGCRVKQIVLNDNWQGLNNDNTLYENAEYGQVYDYTLEDGTTSSGVAEYEPLIGGEENPFRRPVRFSSDRLIIKDEALMIEEPFNENLFPSANVGYSRVSVRNIIQEDAGTQDVNKAVSGIIINEFYTARDFPVITKKTGVGYEGYNVVIPIPFIGGFEHHNNGYSQGYSIELNNMHGKPYSVATYIIPLSSSEPKPGTPGSEPVAATYYHYKTQQPFVRNKPTGNKLSNTVEVLTADAVVSEVEIGKHVETYIDMRENKTNIISGEITANTNTIIIPFTPPLTIVIPIGIPSLDNSYSMFRSVATNKTITRNGILDKQVTTKEGAKTITQNIYYDGETGSPLLTTVTNDFDKPIYDYTYVAHWEHEGMQGAYKNIGAIVSSSTSSLVRPGDELLKISDNSKYWVEEDGSLKDEDGVTQTPSGDFKIIRSGYRNQQSEPMGSIISLTNPVTERVFPMFAAINSFSIPAITYPITTDYDLIIPGDEVSFEDCLTSEEFNNLRVTIIGNGNEITIKDDNTEREGSICGYGIDNPTKIVFPSSVNLTDPLFFDVATMVLTKHGSTLVKAKDGNGKEIWGELIRGECLNECLDGVLHASATKYKSSWLIDYNDAVPSSELPAYFTTYPNDITTRFGADNIWRLHESFIFNVTRKQTNPTIVSNTQTGIDGTYESFGLFNWSANAPNVKWVKANQINLYSPYGFELESQDALEIKSAALYGYSNSLATAVASNTEYRELAFDGFEDYNGLYGSTSPTPKTPNYGHIEFTGTHSLVTTEAHTGDYAMQITNGNVANFENVISTAILNTQFTPDINREYYVSAWVKLGTGASASLTVTAGSNPAVVANTSSSQQKIEGWQRLEIKFSTAGTIASDPVIIEFEANGGTIYLDDVRVQPFVSNMKTFVYDPLTLWLKAELDDRNYATIYSYDEEGSLVQIKKETKAGMRTIVSNRKNIKKNSTLINP